MKILNELFVFSIVIFTISSMQIYNQCDPYNALWAIGESNVRYLRYITFKNGFDSADVNYRVGEFRIINQGNEIRLNFLTDLAASECIIGDSLLGEDLLLKPYTKTESFILPDTLRIKFFRELSARRPCFDNPPSGPVGGGYGDWTDKHWIVGQGNIEDLSEFVLQLVKNSDSTVILNIDSVGVAPNPNSIYAQRYGTDPNKMNHDRSFITGLGGTECHLEVSPRRIGPTPFGMSITLQPSDFSFSSFLEYDSVRIIYKCGPEQHHLIDSIFSAKLLFYLDSVRNATGWLPSTDHLGLSDSLLDVIHNLYYIRDSMTINDTTIYFWTYIGAPSYPKRGDYYELTSKNSTSYYIKNISPMPVTNNKCNVEIYVENNLNNASLHLMAVVGSPISHLWRGNLIKGENYVNLDFSDYYNGTYIIVLRDATGTNLHHTRIIIGR